jgi:DUF4097 and DUF4098 domain-containing protein YvlB
MYKKLFNRALDYGYPKVAFKIVVRFTSVLLIVAVLLACAACATGDTVQKDDIFTVEQTPKIIVKSENGSIELNTGANDEVRVQATLKGSDRIEYEVIQEANTITVDVKLNKPWWVFSSVGADIVITAPDLVDVEFDTNNGLIEVDGMEGNGTLMTSNGKIVIRNVKGDFNASTSNGYIDVNSIEGNGIFHTSNGKVELRRMKGEVDVDTSNGDIKFSGEMTAGGTNYLVTSNGNIDIELLLIPSVSLNAKTNNGMIDCDLEILATETKEDHLEGIIGDGEAELYVRTSNGDINIK